MANLRSTRDVKTGKSLNLGFATRATRLADGTLSVVHHATEIVRIGLFGSYGHNVKIDAAGWRSRTTLERINHALECEGVAARVSDHGATVGWRVHFGPASMAFCDGMVLRIVMDAVEIVEPGRDYPIPADQLEALATLGQLVKRGHELNRDAINAFCSFTGRRVYFGAADALRTMRRKARHHAPDFRFALPAILRAEGMLGRKAT